MFSFFIYCYLYFISLDPPNSRLNVKVQFSVEKQFKLQRIYNLKCNKIMRKRGRLAFCYSLNKSITGALIVLPK